MRGLVWRCAWPTHACVSRATTHDRPPQRGRHKHRGTHSRTHIQGPGKCETMGDGGIQPRGRGPAWAVCVCVCVLDLSPASPVRMELSRRQQKHKASRTQHCRHSSASRSPRPHAEAAAPTRDRTSSDQPAAPSAPTNPSGTCTCARNANPPTAPSNPTSASVWAHTSHPFGADSAAVVHTRPVSHVQRRPSV